MNNNLKNFIFLIILSLFACSNSPNDSNINSTTDNQKNISTTNLEKEITKTPINVNFSLNEHIIDTDEIIEDSNIIKSLERIHSVKYYSYMPSPESTIGDYVYYDNDKNKKIMTINQNVPKNNYKWEDENGVLSKYPPIGHNMSFGIDVSKHNGNIDFIKIKNAGFDFVFVRVVYRRYGKAGKLEVDELQSQNLKFAKNAGLKVGAYVFSQAINEEEAKEEAKLAIEQIKNIDLDLPIVFNANTIKNSVARTDNVEGEQFTKNAIAFCEEIKNAGYTPTIYANMVWEDYYYDMEKLKNYEIWYSDYNSIPQAPYNFKFWQFSDIGIVDGCEIPVGLNVMIE